LVLQRWNAICILQAPTQGHDDVDDCRGERLLLNHCHIPITTIASKHNRGIANTSPGGIGLATSSHQRHLR
jgi:hypothetical protein